jgi:hypothetical protein
VNPVRSSLHPAYFYDDQCGGPASGPPQLTSCPLRESRIRDATHALELVE